ncbi:isoprenylcysteine carboxyl methyltransferase family protein [Halalkalibacter alkaliphilus]|uniref:Isoprenylcysteine carboxyl methyltransferase family protein n=1 Tax=Halalkalibacter alkaliphilus TaxID=2917993 RepID=A0A9X2CSW2_9BACI|nr:isoprenylcysteine carboxyl methyltransferase family protein [Halalkalibacter alkaliphilus]MCL7747618.1 isoprenylcysteine carboxyl methyltransferase family protein [Halalkalibacter alkaliphilus]
MLAIYVFILVVVVQRVVEVVIANRNAKWIKSQGGYEVGKDHYKQIVALHTMFFVSLLIEVSVIDRSFVLWSVIPLLVFLLAQMGRVWALSSLGRFWNTRIMVLPGAKVIAKGPYRYLRHPNYVIVVTEIACLPLIFQAYWTAIAFTIINAFVLSVRIKMEEAALEEATNYQEVFEKHKRFIPSSNYED